MINFDDLLTQLQGAQTESEREWVALKFNLATQPDSVQKAVMACSVPHWFNFDMLNAMLEKPIDNNDFNALLALPYIEEFPNFGWNTHEKTRLSVINNLYHENKDDLISYSRRAALWSRKYHPAEPEWRIESIYLSLIAGEKKSKERFMEFAESLLNTDKFLYLETLAGRVLDAAKNDWLSGEVVGWAWYFYGRAISILGRHLEALNAFEKANTLAGADHLLKARALENMGSMHISLSNLEDAQKCLNEAITYYSKINNVSGEANCIVDLATASLHSSQYNEAHKLYNLALRKFQAGHDLIGTANCKTAFADLLAAEHQFEKSKQQCIEALKIYEEKLRSPIAEGACYGTLATIYMSIGDLDKSKLYCDRSLSFYKSVGAKLGEANAYASLGSYNIHLYEYERARELFSIALAIYRSIKDHLGEANVNVSLGEIHREFGEFDQAERCFNSALEFYKKTGYPFGEVNGYSLSGVVAAERGNFELASIMHKLGKERADQINWIWGQAYSLLTLAEIQYIFKRYEESIESYSKALEYFKEIPTYISRAKAHLKLRNFDAAFNDIRTAEALKPDYHEVAALYGQLYFLLNEEKRSLEKFNLALARVPNAGIFILWKAACQASLGEDWIADFEDAIRSIRLTRILEDVAENIASHPNINDKLRNMHQRLSTEIIERKSRISIELKN